MNKLKLYVSTVLGQFPPRKNCPLPTLKLTLTLALTLALTLSLTLTLTRG